MNTDKPCQAERLDAHFRSVLADRMRDVPILNASLSVESCGWRRHASGWLGVMITPWCMNLVLLESSTAGSEVSEPGQVSVADTPRNGESCLKTFPAGEYHFTVNHDATAGVWLSCSLFSPMFEFSDQEFARDVAHSALLALFDSTDTVDEPRDRDPQCATDHRTDAAGSPAPMSRRDWFRAALQRDSQ